jgi:hypothetical protein
LRIHFGCPDKIIRSSPFKAVANFNAKLDKARENEKSTERIPQIRKTFRINKTYRHPSVPTLSDQKEARVHKLPVKHAWTINAKRIGPICVCCVRARCMLATCGDAAFGELICCSE